MKRILGILLMVILLTIPFSSVYALETPQQPEGGNFTTNEEIKDYNSKVEKYNEEVDKYNAAVDEEYNAAVEEVNQQNAAGIKAQEDSQKAHDDAIAQNDAIDQQNIEGKAAHDAAEAKKVQASQDEIDKINQENQQIQQSNQAELDRVAQEEQVNNEIKQRNEAAQEQYNIDKQYYDEQSAIYLNNFNTQYNVNWTLEEYETYAKAWNEKYKKDSQYHEATKGRGVAQKDTTDDNFDFEAVTTNNQTITVIPSDNPAEGEDYYVTNIHIYYDGPSDTYYGNAFNLEKNNKLDPRNKSGIVQVKYETVKVNKNDTVTLTSEVPKLIKYSNGNFFNYVDDNHLEGYWHLGSCEYGYLTETDEGYNYGPTYTFSYADTIPLSHVYTVYTYDWSGKYDVLDAPVLEQEELNEIIPPTILASKIVPQLYTPTDYIPIPYKDVPEVLTWTMLSAPEKMAYLAHLSLLDLLPEPEEPTPTLPTPIVTPTPTPTLGPTPVVIYGRGDGDPVEEIQIADAETPTTIAAATIPRAKPKTEEGSWALINLICTILSCIIAAVLLFVKKKTDDEEEEYTDEEKKDIRGIRRFKIYSILVGIISVIAFILTEDMTLPMILIDKWTILMVILLLVNVINIFVMRKKSKEEDDDDDIE